MTPNFSNSLRKSLLKSRIIFADFFFPIFLMTLKYQVRKPPGRTFSLRQPATHHLSAQKRPKLLGTEGCPAQHFAYYLAILSWVSPPRPQCSTAPCFPPPQQRLLAPTSTGQGVQGVFCWGRQHVLAYCSAAGGIKQKRKTTNTQLLCDL